jgi:hypothetical protein
MSDLRARKHKSSPSSRPAFAHAFVGRFVGNTQAARHALVAQLMENLAFDVEAPDRNELESLLFGALERLEIRAPSARSWRAATPPPAGRGHDTRLQRGKRRSAGEEHG